MKRKISVLCVAMAISSILPMQSFASWVSNADGWYYTNQYGGYVTNSWRESNGGQYYVGDDGRMVADALIDTGSGLYYVNENGRRVENCWKELVDEDSEVHWYYFQSSAKAKENGYITIDGVKYHFTDYHLDTGWQDGDNGNIYYYGSEGMNQSGWHYIDGSDSDYDFEPGWYFASSNGKLVKNQEKKIDGRYYVFNSNGLMYDGWVEFTDEDETVCKYYRIGEGNRMDGWVYHNGEDSFEVTVTHPEGWYYLRNGRPYTMDYKTTKISDHYGIAKIGDDYYSFDSSGLMQYGVIQASDGTLYYFGNADDGSMKTGKVLIETDDRYDYEGQTMYFNTSGSIGRKGSDFTGVKNNYLYRNGELVESDSGEWELVKVDGNTYVVNGYGKIKISGTFRDDNDVRWRVQKKAAGGYELVKEL